MRSKGWILVSVVVCLLLFQGCISYLKDSRSYFFNEEKVFNRYYLTLLKFSSSADILGIIQQGEGELISQSESVVASWGKELDNSILWFNMVAFDEEDLMARRKYAFFINEKVKGFSVVPAKKLRFDTEMVLDAEVVEEPYANENQKRIAILRVVLDNFNTDIIEITADSQILKSSSMLVKQVLNTILVKLDQSPALAARLNGLKGMSFDHITLGDAKIRMLIEGDIVKVKIKVGKDWFNQQGFEKHPDVINM